MRWRLIAPIIIFSSLIVSCSSDNTHTTPTSISFTSSAVRSSDTPVPPTQTLAATQTSLPTLTATRTMHQPTQTPVLTRTPIYLPYTRLTTHCLEVLESLPNNADLEGSLVLWRRGGYQEHWFDLSSRILRPLTQEGELAGTFTVSPDGSWLGYITGSPSAGYRLVISRVNEPPITIRQPMENMDLMGWLDNEHLVLVRYQEETYLDPLIVLNPFTGQQVELMPDYPDIDYINGTIYWYTSRTVYDPTLTLVVYPRSGYYYNEITLWDIPNNQSLAAVPGYVSRGEHPEWSPDGETVSIVGLSPASLPNGHDFELYLVSRAGVVTQATNLSQYYTNIFIHNRSWSPDGRYIAFWLRARPIGYEGDTSPEQLLLLDTATMVTTNTCIHGGELSGGPYWSPDGEWMAVTSQCDESNEDCIVLVNVVENYAVRIIDQWIVSGWVVNP